MTTLSILCLHGAHQDEEVFRYKTDRLRSFLEKPPSSDKPPLAKLFYTQAPHVLPLIREGDEMNMRVWYREQDMAKPGEKVDREIDWAASSAHLAAFVQNQMQGKVDMILGFSQGCVAAIRILNDIPTVAAQVKAVILAGCPLVEPREIGVDAFTPFPSTMRSLHVIGDLDTLVPPSDSLELADHLFVMPTILRHPHAHVVPHTLSEISKIADFVEQTQPPPNMEELKEALQMEIETLGAIFESVKTVTEPSSGLTTVTVDIAPEADTAVYLALLLPVRYPMEAAKVQSISGPYIKKVSETRSNLFLRWNAHAQIELIEAAEALQGTNALFQLCSTAKDQVDQLVAAVENAELVGDNDEDEQKALDPWTLNDSQTEEGVAQREAFIAEAQLKADRTASQRREAIAASLSGRVRPGAQSNAGDSAALGGGEWKYVIGLVGKPSAGKSTFFNAVTDPQTEAEAGKVGAFPFTTIEPNVGKAFVGVPCPCQVMSEVHPSQCGAKFGHFPDSGLRRVPVTVKDVAGLVPGAYQGHGKGNRFLNDLCDADVLVHVLDGSGRSTADGVEVGDDNDAPDAGPAHDVRWVRNEIHNWIFDNVRAKWEIVKRKPSKFLTLFSGYHARASQVEHALEACGVSQNTYALKIPLWGPKELHLFIAQFIALRFPIVLALNKSDTPKAALHAARVKKEFPHDVVVRMSARVECEMLALRREGVVNYLAGSTTCTLNADESPWDVKPEDKVKRKEFAEKLSGYIAKAGGTGTAQCLQTAVSLRPALVVFPVKDFTSYHSPLPPHTAEGTILATQAGGTTSVNGAFHSCLLMRQGTTVEDLYRTLCDKHCIDGKFVRCEGVHLRRKQPLGTGLAPPTTSQEPSNTGGEEAESNVVILRRDDVLSDFVLCRVMTNKRSV